MKVAFLSYAYGQLAYGAGRYAWHLTEELKKLGHNVDVFTPELHLSKTGPLLFSFKNLFKNLKKYDIVHSNEAAGFFVSHPAIIETYHHNYAKVPEFGHYFFNILEMTECHKAKHIIVPSHSSENALLDFGFSPKKISTIYHGVDQIFKQNLSLRRKIRFKLGLSNHFVIINVGRLVKHKRQIDLINSLKGIQDVLLILVGTGSEEQNLRKAALQAGVKLLHFNAVSDKFLVGLYNASDVYVHTSSLEGFGLTIIEAMSCGLPIIAYKTADLEKIVENVGFLFNIGDVKGINNAIQHILENVDLRTDLKTEALNKSKMFSWSESARRHSQLYTSVLARNF